MSAELREPLFGDNEVTAQSRSYRKPTFIDHYIAILFRKFTLLKRSWKTILIATIGSIFFCGLAILISFLIKVLVHDSVKPIKFDFLKHQTNELMLIIPNNTVSPTTEIIQKNINTIVEMFINDTGRYPHLTNFSSRDEFNRYMYHNAEYHLDPLYVALGIGFENYSIFPNIQLYYNGTWGESASLMGEVGSLRMLWKNMYGKDKDFTFSSTRLLRRIADYAFSIVGPILVCAGLISMIPIFIFQPIVDIKGDVRGYMDSCGLKIIPYWLATFTVDCTIWLITSSFVWVMFYVFNTTAVMENLRICYYVFVMSGPAFIMFTYCFSFAFASAESAPRQSFIILVILMIVPFVVDLIRQPDPAPLWLDYIYAILPHWNLQRILTFVFANISVRNQSFEWYFHDSNSRAYIIFEYVDVLIYIIILLIIEKTIKVTESAATKHKFNKYTEFFEEQRSKHPVTDEAKQMAEAVRLAEDSQWAVKIDNVSRLFFNTVGEPVPAVNNVSLGVKPGSIFGFLGANGAGKTTLIKMITSLLPPSQGSIQVNGTDITKERDTSVLAICPQFNSHLCMEMTPQEHFFMYGKIFGLPRREAEGRTKRLVDGLGLGGYIGKPAGQLSGGEQRKLAIALSFFGPASIILLDEPTAPLDPVARHNVHQLIQSYRGEKTFMLCTHLLSEAEALCDMISVMIKGCVYTCGSPQYLSQKFGTEYKIDVGLSDVDLAMLGEDSGDSGGEHSAAKKVDRFFAENLPDCTLSIRRPSARIYSMPASVMDLADLFAVMEKGAHSDNGFKYYTCSSSSLERVFMELIHMSTSDDDVRVP